MTAGEYAYRGADLAILFLNQVIRNPQGNLNEAGQLWVEALKQCFQYRQLDGQERALVELSKNPGNSKSGRAS